VLSVYQSLAHVAQSEFGDIVTHASYVGGTPASPNKLRLTFSDGSFLDIWLSADGDYAYHWEQRRQRGQLHRWDNAPHHPHVGTFPAHLHEGDEHTLTESHLSAVPETALRDVLTFIRRNLPSA